MGSILTIVFFAFMAFVCVASVPMLFRAQLQRQRTRARGIPITGTVIESGVDDETQFVVLEYEHAGVRFQFREYYMGGKIGKQIPLLVDPDNPARVVPRNAPARWFIAPAILLCGLAMAGICVALSVKTYDEMSADKPDRNSVRIEYWEYLGDDGKMSIHFTPPTEKQREATRQYRANRLRNALYKAEAKSTKPSGPTSTAGAVIPAGQAESGPRP